MTALQRSASRRDLCARLRSVLVEAQSHRAERDGRIVNDEGTAQVAWVVWEREQMHSAVNAEREALGLGPVPIAEVKAAEQQACGHSDYVDQFAWGCAGLVLESEPRRDT